MLLELKSWPETVGPFDTQAPSTLRPRQRPALSLPRFARQAGGERRRLDTSISARRLDGEGEKHVGRAVTIASRERSRQLPGEQRRAPMTLWYAMPSYSDQRLKAPNQHFGATSKRWNSQWTRQNRQNSHTARLVGNQVRYRKSRQRVGAFGSFVRATVTGGFPLRALLPLMGDFEILKARACKVVLPKIEIPMRRRSPCHYPLTRSLLR